MANEKYFENLLSSKESLMAEALDTLVEELNNNKERTIFNFLGHSGSEDFLWALVSMLSSKTIRIASNAAYVIGSLAETELGSHRVLSLTQGRKAAAILQDLTHMLTVEDAETVMNAAGTLGTLAETDQGREWMLKQSCMQETMTNITFLLGSDNHWTASNSALVLARITISETGAQALLDHPRSNYMLTRLIQSLGNDAAGRGMNAAFAIGRLLDTKRGKDKLLNCADTDKMMTSLCRMLSKGDMGGAKNACFAISCLATDVNGNQRLLGNSMFQDVINRLMVLLSNTEDREAAWFSAMTLRTMSSHKQGVLRLRQNNDVESALMKSQNRPNNSKELNEEIHKTLMHLKKLDHPDPPDVQVRGSTSVYVEWKPVNTHSGLQITYKLYEDKNIVYKGKELNHLFNDLRPFTTYSYKIRASTIGDDSPFSEITMVTTDEDIPSAPTYFRIVAASPTQLRLSWNPPEHMNGILRGYTVFLGEKALDIIPDTSYIITRLIPATRYSIHVCASTSKGLGDRATIVAVTEELGAHAPHKPIVTVIGRNEIHVSWFPPAVPLGRFFRYELCMNDRVVYLGTDKVYRATGLIPDTDYVFVVVAITSEGRCVSESTKKRTQKDKSQIEPGHHKLKTHSFMAKEFQVMQEKSKSQPIITPPQKAKPKLKKKNSLRPASTISSSNISETSGLTDGTWAHNDIVEHVENDESTEMSLDEEKRQNSRKYRNPAVLGGSPIRKMNSSNPHSHRVNFEQDAHLTQDNYSDAHKKKEYNAGKRNILHTKRPDERSNILSQKAKPDPVSWAKSQKLYSSAKEFSFNKENDALQKMSATHNRLRLHKGNAIMKGGKKVLKTDKEILASMPVQDQTSSGQSKLVRTGIRQNPVPYYPDIISQLTKGETGKIIQADIQMDGVPRKNSDTPDSLNAEPGTARVDDLGMDEYLPSQTEVPPIKQPLPHYLVREKHINEYQLHEMARSKGQPFRIHHSNYGAPKLSTKATHMYGDQIILKSNPTSKYGLKYTTQQNSESSESSVDNDSAFHSLSQIQDGVEDMNFSSIQKPLRLQPLISEHVVNQSKASSERHLNRELPEARLLSSRLKTPPKGYWSDHDAYPVQGKKTKMILTPINYKTFTGAHRPTKSIRLESPLITNSDTWFVNDSVANGDNNRYKFFPTQLRTQPANLPLKSGKIGSRLESLNNLHFKTEKQDKQSRTFSVTSGSHSPSPPSRRRHDHVHQRRPHKGSALSMREIKTQSHLRGSRNNSGHVQSAQYGISDLDRRNNDKYGSALTILSNYHSNEVNNLISASFPVSRTVKNLKGFQNATSTNLPHTTLSPLPHSDISTTPSKSSPDQAVSSSSKSPRLRMTSSSSSPYYHQALPTASGYNISPTSSLSPLLNSDQNLTHLRQMALIQGGGDAV